MAQTAWEDHTLEKWPRKQSFESWFGTDTALRRDEFSTFALQCWNSSISKDFKNRLKKKNDMQIIPSLSTYQSFMCNLGEDEGLRE